jgi:hypothetical protein
MQLLADDEVIDWCSRRGIRGEQTSISSRLTFGNGESHRLRVVPVDNAHRVVGLAHSLLMRDTPDYDEAQFPGALVWLTRWEIWSESIDGAGFTLLNGLRSAVRQAPSVDYAPGHLFASGEFAQAHACLVLPMLFQWDAYLIPASGDFFALLSHHGHVELTGRNPEAHAALLDAFPDGERF